MNEAPAPRPNGGMADWMFKYFDRLIHETDRRYEERFEGQEKAVAAALAAQEKAVAAALAAAALAVDKAEANSEKWRANANEWRAAMNDREEAFPSKLEIDAKLASIDKQIVDLKKSRDQGEGRLGGISAGWGYLVGFVGLIAAVISIIIATQ